MLIAASYHNNSMQQVDIIPARLNSQRFPNKILLDLKGLPMLEHVRRRVQLAQKVEEVYIATCDQEIKQTLEVFGAKVIMTSDQHKNGTTRVAEAVKNLDCSEVILVQGDEPLIDINSVNKLADFVRSKGSNYATICKPFESSEDEADVNKVKVHVDSENMAVSFFRKATDDMTNTFHHIGVYAYSVGFLNTFSSLPQSPNEEALKLEQMRALDNNHNIHVLVVEDHKSIGIDTPEDLEKFKILIEQIENN